MPPLRTVEDHNQLRGLLKQLTKSTAGEAGLRHQLLNDLVDVLSVHVQIEDELFYPAIAEVSTLLGAAHAEHRQIDDQLAVVLRTDPAGGDFHTEVTMLADTLDHHAGEEEDLMFVQAQALGGSTLGALGDRMQNQRAQLRASRITRTRIRLKRETLRRR